MGYPLVEAGCNHAAAAAHSLFVYFFLGAKRGLGEGSIGEVLEIMLTDYIQKVGSPLDKICLVQLREVLRKFPFGYCEGGDELGGIWDACLGVGFTGSVISTSSSAVH